MKHAITILALAALAATPALASGFSITRGVKVTPVDGSNFEVTARGGRVGDYWCGAAEYARLELGAGWADRIYVLRGRGGINPGGGSPAVQFTLDPQAGGTLQPGLGWLRVGIMAGDSMSVQSGRSHCEPGPVRF